MGSVCSMHGRAPSLIRTLYRFHTVANGVPQGVPATATEMSEDSIRLFCQSKELYVPESEAQKSFKELLEGWGGCWMWEDLRLTEDLEWIVESLQNKSLVCVTDGLYDKQRAPDVCSAGWIMKCRRTGRQISGSLVEVSPSAGSYRGEMLGMLAIRLLLLAVEEYFGAITKDNRICCDNKEAIFTFEKKSKRVIAGKSNADIWRVLRSIKARTRSSFL